MATQAFDNPAQANYPALLTFIDVVYSALLGYGLFLFIDPLKPLFTGSRPHWDVLALLSFLALYLIGDYVDSRLYTDLFQYCNLLRFWMDLTIAFAFFLAFAAGWQSSAFALLFLAVVSLTGMLWLIALNREHADTTPLRFLTWLAVAHVGLAVIFCWQFWRITKLKNFGAQISAYDVKSLWIDYIALSACYVFLEIALEIPSVEADLFPTFPMGRLGRLLLKPVTPYLLKAKWSLQKKFRI